MATASKFGDREMFPSLGMERDLTGLVMTTGNLVVDKMGSLTTLSHWSGRYSSIAKLTRGSVWGKQEFPHKTVVQGCV